jgi:hypothetical protein
MKIATSILNSNWYFIKKKRHSWLRNKFQVEQKKTLVLQINYFVMDSSNQTRPPTSRKSLTNYLSQSCIEYTSTQVTINKLFTTKLYRVYLNTSHYQQTIYHKVVSSTPQHKSLSTNYLSQSCIEFTSTQVTINKIFITKLYRVYLNTSHYQQTIYHKVVSSSPQRKSLSTNYLSQSCIEYNSTQVTINKLFITKMYRVHLNTCSDNRHWWHIPRDHD